MGAGEGFLGTLGGRLTRQAVRDAKKLAKSGLKERAQILLVLISADPFGSPPLFEKLVGDLFGT